MSTVDAIAAEMRARRDHSDREILDELAASPALADEDDVCWEAETYWDEVVHPYLAFAELARNRRLRPAVILLLDRACFGDPGEISISPSTQ